MTDPIVLDIEVAPVSLEKWLIDYGKNREDGLSDDVAGTAVSEGFLFDTDDRNFTEKGLDLLEANGVILKKFFTLTLGHAISPIDKNGDKWNLQPGSQVLILFSGDAKKAVPAWDDVMVSDQFPIVRIYRNSADSRAEHRWPITWPLGGKSKFVPLTSA